MRFKLTIILATMILIQGCGGVDLKDQQIGIPAGNTSTSPTSSNEFVYFIGLDSNGNSKLFAIPKSGGSIAQVSNTNPGGDDHVFAVKEIGGKLYFSATDGGLLLSDASGSTATSYRMQMLQYGMIPGGLNNLILNLYSYDGSSTLKVASNIVAPIPYMVSENAYPFGSYNSVSSRVDFSVVKSDSSVSVAIPGGADSSSGLFAILYYSLRINGVLGSSSAFYIQTAASASTANTLYTYDSLTGNGALLINNCTSQTVNFNSSTDYVACSEGKLFTVNSPSVANSISGFPTYASEMIGSVNASSSPGQSQSAVYLSTYDSANSVSNKIYRLTGGQAVSTAWADLGWTTGGNPGLVVSNYKNKTYVQFNSYCSNVFVDDGSGISNVLALPQGSNGQFNCGNTLGRMNLTGVVKNNKLYFEFVDNNYWTSCYTYDGTSFVNVGSNYCGTLNYP